MRGWTMKRRETVMVYDASTDRLIPNEDYVRQKQVEEFRKNFDKKQALIDDDLNMLDKRITDLMKGSLVDHPKHYNTGKFEVIDVVADWLTDDELRGFIKGNVLKYVARERHKNGLEDLKKARFYLDYLITKEEEK